MGRKEEQRVCTGSADGLLAKANVVGVAPTGRGKLAVLVTEKVPLDQLHADDVVPETVQGYETEVVGVGPFKAKLQAGASIGLRNAGTGTAGGVVRDEHGKPYVLTNNHVAANNNAAVALSPVHSPGPADGLGARIGRLGRYEPLWFGREERNYVDAALVPLDAPNALRTHPPRWVTAQVGWNLRFVGRTSGPGTGQVLSRGAVVAVDMGGGRTARFYDTTITTFMLRPGDSGSVITTTGGFPCLLGFAGSDSISLGNPIGTVLRTLGVDFR